MTGTNTSAQNEPESNCNERVTAHSPKLQKNWTLITGFNVI